MGWKLNDVEFSTLGCNAEMEFSNGLADAATVTFAFGGLDDACPIDADDDVVIKHPDGSVYFRGVAEAPVEVNSGGSCVWQVTVLSKVAKLERITYKQPYAVAGGGTKYFGRVALGVGNDGTRRTTAQTITDILSWGATRGSGITTGTILSGTSLYWPPVDAVDISCLEAIRQVLRAHPDAVLHYNHDSSTLAVTRPGSMSTVTKACTGDGSGCTGVTIRAARMRAVTGVRITYYVTTDVDGAQEVDFEEDTAGDVSDSSPRLLEFSVDLDGGKTTTQAQEVVTEDLPTATGDVTEAWLTAKFPELAAVGPVLLSGLGAPLAEVVSVSQVVDVDAKQGSGTIPGGGSPAYPRALVGGSLPPWQSGISSAPTTLTIRLKWKGNAANNPALYALFPAGEKVLDFHLQVRGTDAQSITYRTAATTPGESPPTGLAADYYAALGTEQPAGSASWVAASPDVNIKPGKKLTLTGDRTVTGAVIQSVKVSTLTGRLAVTFGPMNGKLSPEQWISMMRNGQRSRPFTSASGSGRTDPAPKSTTEVQGGLSTAFANTGKTTPAPPAQGFRVSQASATSVTVAAGWVSTAELGEFTGTEDPIWAKIGKDIEIDSDEVTVANGDTVYLRLDYGSTPAVYTSVKDGSGEFEDSNSDTFNLVWSATLGCKVWLCAGGDFVAQSTAPTDTAQYHHIALADIGITGGIMSITPRFEGRVSAAPRVLPYMDDFTIGQA